MASIREKALGSVLSIKGEGGGRKEERDRDREKVKAGCSTHL